MNLDTREKLDRIIEPRSGSIFSKKKYGAAIYFENDPEQIKQVEVFCTTKNFDIVEIPESPRETLKQDLANVTVAVRSNPNNLYVKMKSKISQYHKILPTEHYDPRSGIQQVHIDRLRTWLARTSEERFRVALFDWDRTITMFEGVTLLEPNAVDFKDAEGSPVYPVGQIREDTLRFALGGAERLASIRQAMTLLWKNNVDIVIITNNQGCSDSNPYYLALVNQLFQGVPYSVLCSLPYQASKGRALSDNNFNFCNLRIREKSPDRK